MDRPRCRGKPPARRKIGGLRTRKTAHQGNGRPTDRETVEPEQTKNHPKPTRNAARTTRSSLRGTAGTQQPLKTRSKTLPIKSIENAIENDELATIFLGQLKHVNLKTGEVSLLKRIASEAACINRTIDGTMETNMKITNKQLENLKDEPASTSGGGTPKVRLIPCSQWVYETPDKQRIKRMEELNFNDIKPSLEPAVFEATEKIVYGLNDKGNKIDLTRFRAGQEVPINRTFLTPVNVDKAPVEENQFLTQSELTININDENNKVFSNPRKRRHEGSDELNWYEKHMKQLATCRPAKERTDRRQYVLRKSLSFQEDTPTSHLRLKCRYRSLDESNSYRSREDDDEDETSLLEEDFYHHHQQQQQQSEDDRLPIPDSPQLSSILGNVYLNNNTFTEIPPPRFYPRRNYD